MFCVPTGSGRLASLTVLLIGAGGASPSAATAAPETTIDSSTPTASGTAMTDGANDDFAQFAFSSAPAGATFECRLDAGAWAACSSPKSYDNLPDGAHTFSVRAKDSQNNVDPTPATFNWTSEPVTGMWYSTWYTTRGLYNWATDFGYAATKRFLADVNGDGDDDAVAFYNNADAQGVLGRWYVALSDGDGFGPPTLWASGFGGFSVTHAMMADVDADGRSDAVAYSSGLGYWWVSRSDGTKFGTTATWKTNMGVNATTPLLADVNGDQRADAVAYFANGGYWNVALAKTSADGFGTTTNWAAGFGSGNSQPILADMTGPDADGKHRSDATLFDPSNGVWAVAQSEQNANNFDDTPAFWAGAGFEAGAVKGLAGDVTGDGRADGVAYMGNGEWRRLVSTGVGFAAPADPPEWKMDHGGSGTTVEPMLGNVDKALDDDNANAHPPTMDPVVYSGNEGGDGAGHWRFLPAEGRHGQSEPPVDAAGQQVGRTDLIEGETYLPYNPRMWNFWQARNIDYRPVTWTKYDSFDKDVLDGHLRQARDVKIDFLLVDETNGVRIDGVALWNHAVRLCQRGKALRAAGEARIPRLAAAIGRFGQGTGKEIKADGDDVLNDLVHNAQCGDLDSTGVSNGYQKVKGKPVIDLYLQPVPKANFIANTDGSGGYAYVNSNFTIRWHQGAVQDDPISERPTDWQFYYGWVFRDGSLANPQSMVVMPGWQSDTAANPVSRLVTINGQPAQFYDVCGWKRVLNQQPRPDVVVINSYNEYAEKTAVAPTTAPDGMGWPSATYYWDQTRTYNAARKAPGSGAGTNWGPGDATVCNHDG
jgi:hypothetical protein